ncbi:MAG: undecaprenyl/decaprenyl-phosphate alpha-N-acetylglucosaminyl 1-phosphate transferase [Verrucomicrobiota bacterium]|nr:undecaprenyl/decaprenyl-phosphate alpha-N-acetylglucosaminyl 1-phosphate transferase [Verrucomicrobiota bacterium]
MIRSLIFFVMGFLLSFLTTPWVINLSKRGFGLDDANETRKRHEGLIPRIGGMPIMFTLSIGLIIILSIRPEYSTDWFPVLLGSVLMFAVGLWDDLVSLNSKAKFGCQIAIATLVYFLGLSIDRVTYPGGAWSVELHGWSLPITVFWLIAVPNIINLIDGFDGLAGGLGLFMAMTLGIVGIISEQIAVAWYSFTMAGALLGFLVFNFPPARVFLGDGGAYLIGFSIAALSMTSSHKGSIAAVLLVTIVALGVPILDTSFALLRRAFRGFPLFAADDEHIHHRLENLGFSKRRIVLGMYGICVVLSVIGLSIFWSQGRTIPIAIGAIFLLTIFAAQYLQYIKNWANLRKQVERILVRRPLVQYALLQAQLMEIEVERCTNGEEFWPLFDSALRRIGFVDTPGAESHHEIQVKWNGTKRWILHAPDSIGSDIEWQRIAECFRPVYVKAMTKWSR